MIAFVTANFSARVCVPSTPHLSSYLPASTWIGARPYASSQSSFIPHQLGRLSPRTCVHPSQRAYYRRCSPCALGGAGGFLGVGPAEVFVVIAVGWFLLGPTKLYALAKDIGQVLGELRKTADDTRKTFQEAMDVELEKGDGAEPNVIASLLEKQLDKRNSTETDTESSIPISKDGEDSTSTVSSETSDKDESLTSASSDQKDSSIKDYDVTKSGESNAEEPALSAQFLDQIRRVSDPNQVPLSDVPDLDMNAESEAKEVERLEKEYLAARARLEKRKSKENPESIQETPPLKKQAPDESDPNTNSTSAS